MVSLFVYVSSVPAEDDAELSSSGWYSPQPPQDTIPICYLDESDNIDRYPLASFTSGSIIYDSIIVDGCLLDCGGKTIRSSITSDYSSSVIIRNGGHVKDCPLLLSEVMQPYSQTFAPTLSSSSFGTSSSTYAETLSSSSFGTSSGTYVENKLNDQITGFLCDEGDCTLTNVSCNISDGSSLVFRECVLVKSGAATVTINGGLVTDQEKLISLYGIVVDAGNGSDAAVDDDESEDNNRKKIQLFVRNVTIVNQRFDGIKILNGVETIRITDSIVSNNRGDGIEVKGDSGLKFLAIIGGAIENNGKNGIEVFQFRRRGSDDSIVDAVVDTVITDVVVNDNGENGIRIVRANKVVIDDVTIGRNGLNGIDVQSANVINIQGIISKNNAFNGFSTVAAGSDVTITNSVFLNNGYDIQNIVFWKRSGVYTWRTKSVVITNTVSNGNSMDGFLIYNSPTLIMSYVDAMRNGNDGIQVRESSTAYGYDYTSGSDYLVGVYYYPWHGKDFHNGQGYLRKELDPPQLPMLGEYNDSDPAVIAQHME